MKTKDSNFFQQHVEKLMLAVGVLALAAIVFFYVLGDPYAVEYQGESVSPARAPQMVLESAKRLQKRMQTSDDLKFPQPAKYADHFEKLLQRPVLSVRQLAAIVPPSMSSGLGNANYPAYDLPSPPVATDLKAESGYAVLGNVDDPALRRKWLALMGVKSQPYDFRYVSVAATFDLGAWRDRVMGEPDAKRIPASWFYPAIAGVYLQRQTLDARTGQWGHTTIIKPLPGRMGVTDADQDWSLEDAEKYREAIKENQSQVARPQFVPLANNERWLPPALIPPQLTPSEDQKLHRLFQRMDQWQNRQEKLLRQIKDIEDRAAQNQNGGGNNVGLFPGQNQQNTSNLPPAVQDQIKRLQSRLHTYQMRIYQTAQDEAALLGRRQPVPPPPGGVSSDSSGNQPGGPPSGMTSSSRGPLSSDQPPAPQLPQLGPNQWRVWAHDLTAKAGHTYRYRVIVTVLNPLYHRLGVAKAQKQKNFKKFALAPSAKAFADSPWTQVTLMPKNYFFFVEGSPRRSEAKLQVWRIYDGIWRDAKFQQQPGDAIGGSAEVKVLGKDKVPVSFQTDDLFVDLSAIGQGQGTMSRTQLLYLDEVTGRIGHRLLSQDSNAPMRTRLDNEQRLTMRQAEQAAGGGKDIYGQPLNNAPLGSSGGPAAGTAGNEPSGLSFQATGNDPYANDRPGASNNAGDGVPMRGQAPR